MLNRASFIPRTLSRINKNLHTFYVLFLSAKKDKDKTAIQPKYGARIDGLPTYRRDEIAKHNTMEKQIWVTYNHGVYNITEFLIGHPGTIMS